MNALDTRITLYLNSLHNPFCDSLFFAWTHTSVWIPAIIVFTFAIYLSTHGTQRQRAFTLLKALALIVLAILLSDQITSSLLKPLVQRPRPTHGDIQTQIHTVNGYVGGAYGFPSSHAANAAAFAFCSIGLLRNKIWTCIAIAWAAITSYTRIYLGVHYIGDVLVGAAVGLAVGFTLYKIMYKKDELAQSLILTTFALFIPIGTITATIIWLIINSI